MTSTPRVLERAMGGGRSTEHAWVSEAHQFRALPFRIQIARIWGSRQP
jgi:hypothetical protein